MVWLPPLPLGLCLHLVCLLLQTPSATHARRPACIAGSQRLVGLAQNAAPLAQLAFTRRPAAVAVDEPDASWLVVRLLPITPPVAAREDILDALVCLELARLRRPVRRQRPSVHVLELAGLP